MHEFQWLKPHIIAQIRFVEWTTDGHLRHAAFLGLRTDKKPKDVRRERERKGDVPRRTGCILRPDRLDI